VGVAAKKVPAMRNIVARAKEGHVRRGFFDAAKGGDAPIAEEALRRFAALYAIERDIRAQSLDARHTVRQERSKPLIDAMHASLEDKKRRMFSGSPTLAAIN
jgi:transposase